MLLKILDALSAQQTIITRGQEAIAGDSGQIVATSVAQIAAEASSTRSGFFLQNVGTNDMWLNDLGVATASAGCIKLIPGAILSSMDSYPVNTNALSIIGTAGDGYTLRVW